MRASRCAPRTRTAPLPSYFQRTDVAYDVRGYANCANMKRRREYLRSQIRTDTTRRPSPPRGGASQIVYGTDNPFNWPVKVDVVLNAPLLNNAVKEQVLAGNLMKLSRITS